MKYGVISDIHANYPALKAVMEDMPSDTQGILCLGDFVGLLGYPSEVISTLKEDSVHAVKGNHDVAVLERNEGHVNNSSLSEFELETTLNYSSADEQDWVVSLSPMKRVPDEGILLAHAKPYLSEASGIEPGNPGVRKRDFTSVAAKFSEEFDFVLLGHTHDQAKVDCSQFGQDVTVLNPGSVGMPIGGPAEYAVVNTDSGDSELFSVEYDYDAVIQRLRELDVPVSWWKGRGL